MNKPRYFIHSLARGLKVLQTFAETGQPMSLSEIADAMGTNTTTVTRLFYTLTELGFIHRDRKKLYRLSPKVLTLGYPAICTLGWRKVAQYHLESLFDEIHETVNLSILDGPGILFLIRLRKDRYLPFDLRIGSTLPVYCTSMGKVLMAMGAPENRRSVLEKMDFSPLTPFTIIRMDRFLKELDHVRKKGYAVSDQELSLGVRAVAAPILDNEGNASAAINISVTTMQYTREKLERELAPTLIRTARQISTSLLEMDSPIIGTNSLEILR